METLVQAHGLCKTFRKRSGQTVKAVDGVNLQIAAGEIYGLVGSDGAGKTTTIRLLVGALKLDAGLVSIAGYDISRQTSQARACLGYLSQRFSLYDDLTVLENIRFFTEVRGLAEKDWRPRCMEILEFVGLDGFKDRPAGKLSGGMKQKLGLASALVSRPRVLLLDEPTTGVDPVTRQDFWQLIIQLVASPQNNGVCVLITTPYMDEASRCNRIGFMKAGKIIAEGSAEDLRAILKDRILEVSGSPLPLLRQISNADEDVEDVRVFGDRLHLRLKRPCPEAVIPRLQAVAHQSGVNLRSARPISPMLEDVFMVLAGGS